jgi:hypothetical protein
MSKYRPWSSSCAHGDLRELKLTQHIQFYSCEEKHRNCIVASKERENEVNGEGTAVFLCPVTRMPDKITWFYEVQIFENYSKN